MQNYFEAVVSLAACIGNAGHYRASRSVLFFQNSISFDAVHSSAMFDELEKFSSFRSPGRKR